MTSQENDQEQLLTALDADAGWRAAALAGQRAEETASSLAALNEYINTISPKLEAWRKITGLLGERDKSATATLDLIREAVRKANSKSASINFDNQLRHAEDRMTAMESQEAPVRAGGVNVRA